MATTSLFEVRLVELHDPESGRLDAQKVADYLGVPLRQLAPALGRKYATLHKTPDAVAVQPALQTIKRVLVVLDRVIGDRPTIHAWLQTPHPDLGGWTALDAILAGYADSVATLLDAAMEGMVS